MSQAAKMAAQQMFGLGFTPEQVEAFDWAADEKYQPLVDAVTNYPWIRDLQRIVKKVKP